ncbi:MAG TPA: MarC family protein [Thermoanaerobaculia bacterium]|jgi:multiple antibiotic resistance protein|nr:MarC family protein [Thermoanaerobaculia bacterium]
MLPLWNFGLLAFTSLFTVINPISAAPIFVGMTGDKSAAERRKAALKSSLAAGATLLLFEAAGGLIFSFFGITVPAFQIAGGVLFTMISIRTLNNGREEVEAEAAGADPSIVPLAIPTIAGPGAISTVMALVGQAPNYRHRIALAGAIGAAIAITWLVLLAAPWIVERIGRTGQRIVAKIMGLITCVIGVQFVINGITPVLAGIIKSAR